MAKKKSPAELKEEGATLGELVAFARKREHFFALLIGKDGLVLEADPKKSADVMRRKAKAAGGGPKGAQGIMRVTGKVIEFECDEESPPRMLGKLAKEHFKQRGQMYKVVIRTPGGDEISDGDEEETETEDGFVGRPAAGEDEGEGGGPAGSIGDAPSIPEGEMPEDPRAALQQEYDLQKARIDVAVNGPEKGLSRKVQKLSETFEAEVENDLSKARKVLTLLTTTLDKAGIEADVQAYSSVSGGGAPEQSTEPTSSVSGSGASTEGEASSSTNESGAPQQQDDGMLGGIGRGVSSALGSIAQMPGMASAAGSAVESVFSTLGLTELPETIESVFSSLGEALDVNWDQLLAPTEGQTARTAEQEAIAQQQQRLVAAYGSLGNDPAAVERIAEEIQRLHQMVVTSQQIAALEEGSPEAATEARQAMAGFDEELGPGTTVTPELLAQLESHRATAQADVDLAQQHLEAAQAMPEGPEREAALAAAQEELNAAQPALDAAETRQNAAKGKQQLTQAITVGPLSPSAPRPFSDQSAAQFVEAFTRRPDLATNAIDTASTSQNPEAVAGTVGLMCDMLDNGFRDGEGNAPPDGFDQDAYARNLLTGAGNEGGDYAADVTSYLQSGGHLVEDPIPEFNGDSANGRSRDRVQFISNSVLGEGGSIDTESPEAQQALAHLRFSPDTVDDPVAEVNGRVMDMYEFLSDDENRNQAEGILGNVDDPEGAGAVLVGRSAGAGQTLLDPDADDARRSVMMSMMTPVHQGSVGSCFSTAGVRRLSEEDPLGAMERYAELAETGQFQPANGDDAVPAVLSFPLDEDPLIRSLEYSTASAMAGMEGNDRHDSMRNALNEAVDGLIGPVGESSEFISSLGLDNWEVDERRIRAILESSFIIEYDAMAQSAEQAADGSSDHGGYFLVQVAPSRQVINDKAQFVEALKERVFTATGIDPDSDQGREVASTIESDDYLDDLVSQGRAPWDLGGGGLGVQADEVLFGERREHRNIIGTPDIIDLFQGDTQGDRTEEVLENMLEQFDGNDADMMAIRTVGMHSFNGLPNHPSLAPLQEGGNFEENIQEHLVQPGQEIANQPLEEHHAQEMVDGFRSRMRSFDSSPSAPRAGLFNTAQGANLDLEEKTPGEVADLVIATYDAYLDQLAADEAQGWQNSEVNAGRACPNSARDAKAVEKRAQRLSLFEGWLSGQAARVTPIPKFTIADTNWGDGESRTDFVIAPDPTTGEPRIWKQDLPSGNMRLAGEDWEDAQWMEIAVDD